MVQVGYCVRLCVTLLGGFFRVSSFRGKKVRGSEASGSRQEVGRVLQSATKSWLLAIIDYWRRSSTPQKAASVL